MDYSYFNLATALITVMNKGYQYFLAYWILEEY